MSSKDAQRAALVALLHPPRDFKWAPLRDIVLEERSSPVDVLAERLSGLQNGNLDYELDLASSRIQKWEQDGTRFITYLDDAYPPQLLEAHDLPPFLFARGELLLPPQVERGVSIVGSRKASDEALKNTAEIATQLIEHRLSVISGLAEGIDAAAHTAALVRGARTVGIIGTGIDKYYPRSSSPLQKRMEQGEGLVLSQFWPDASPSRASFPMRNAVMSAYSRATIIVEASEKSGTRHQAHRAIRHGRPLILMRTVAETTTWGKELSNDPSKFDVHVANTATEAVTLAVKLSADLFAADANSIPGISAW